MNNIRYTIKYFIAYLIIGLGIGAYYPVLTLYLLDRLDLNGLQIGTLMAIITILPILVLPFWGIFTDKIKSPKILHISTHGFFLDDENIENPMLKSGLAFAGANNAAYGDSQGVMTGLRLAGLNLEDTQLVVLSACETGLGDINGSEGVTGLNKAFIKAGARNIVMSLWSVADKETAELMQDFYQNIKRTNNYQEALKESKIKMIKQDVHPYYWSAFIMNGI